ncbi:MAG: hypothetical protein M3N42_11065 [Cyanobacteriota bacterium]|nr:hypothetical protein [Cyanobacteriota bacterium]
MEISERKSYDVQTYNSLRRQRIENLLDSSEREEHFFFNAKLIICFKLSSGAILCGTSRAEIDKDDFELEAARKQCYEDAIGQLSRLEEYRVYYQNYQYLRQQYNRDGHIKRS